MDFVASDWTVVPDGPVLINCFSSSFFFLCALHVIFKYTKPFFFFFFSCSSLLIMSGITLGNVLCWLWTLCTGEMKTACTTFLKTHCLIRCCLLISAMLPIHTVVVVVAVVVAVVLEHSVHNHRRICLSAEGKVSLFFFFFYRMLISQLPPASLTVISA